MSHGRKKPRQPRSVRNPIDHAILGATKLTAAEVQGTLATALECEARLREGVATDDQHTVLYTILLIAQGIEDSRIVRGLREHIASALQAMAAIRARATAADAGAWHPVVPDYHEIDAIRTALHLHEFQLQQLSAGELHAVAKKLIARTASSGGQVQRRSPGSLGIGAIKSIASGACVASAGGEFQGGK